MIKHSIPLTTWTFIHANKFIIEYSLRSNDIINFDE